MNVCVEKVGEHHDVVVEVGGEEIGRYRVDGDPEEERRRVETVYRQAALEEILRARGFRYGG